MNEISIFTHAVGEAMNNEWSAFGYREDLTSWEIVKSHDNYYLILNTTNQTHFFSFEAVVFNHEFAKALNGKGRTFIDEDIAMERWMYFLEMMVFAKNRFVCLSRWTEMPF